MSLLTGARKGNLFKMQWKDVDLDIGTWTIEDTKNGSSQVIPLGSFEVNILRERKIDAEGPYVFPGDGKAGHVSMVGIIFDD